MTNVVTIKDRQAVVSHAGNLSDLDNDLTKQVRALINARVRDAVFVQKNVTINRIALKANLAPSTVSKLAYYETTRPAWRTVIAVAEALEILEELGQLMIAYGKARS